jgi:hypothetical protein
MLWRLSRLPLLAVLVLQMALADSIPPRELARKARQSSANRSVPSFLQAVGACTNTRLLAGSVFDCSGRYALRFDGRQENRLPTRMIFMPLGDGQAARPYFLQVGRPSKSFADRILDVFFMKKRWEIRREREEALGKR